MNVIDKMVAAISPDTAVKRQAARYKLNVMNEIINSSGYGNSGAAFNKNGLRGWFTGRGSHKEDIEDNLKVLTERSRDLIEGGSPIATGAVKTMRTNVVGVGLKLKANVDRDVLKLTPEQAQAINRKLEKEFALWASNPSCDLMRLDNFYELQQLAFYSWLMNGDLLVTLPTTKRPNVPYDLRINLIESDRLETPPHMAALEAQGKIIAGVEVNDMGEVVAYHIAKHHPASTTYIKQEWVRVEAYGAKTGRRNVLHIMTRERIGQRRGTPFLSPVIEALKQLSRYTEAELMAAVVSGMYAIFIEKEAPSDGVPLGEVSEDEKISDDENDIEMSNGSIIDLAPGERANVVQPGRPNKNFDAFVMSLCKQIGVALEIPYEILLKEFNASYSASRGALLEYWKTVNMYRGWLASDFCQPIYEEFVTQAIGTGRIKAPGFFRDPLIKQAYCKAEWHGPSNGQLNPLVEVSAAEKRVLNGFSSRAKEAAEMGSNYYDNIEQLKIENELLKGVNENANA